MMSSVTAPLISRVMSSLTRRSSGPTPSIGEMAPPSTWYRPRNSRVRSIATTSLDSSTTQIDAGSRRGSRQIRHVSSSATLPQIEQKRTLSLTSTSTCASRRTSTGSLASRWKAMRCALLGPTPGSRPSSSIRSWTAPSYTVVPLCSLAVVSRRVRSETWQPGPPAEAPREGTHGAGGQLVGRMLGVPDGGDDEVLQRLEVVGIDGGRRDRERGQLAVAGHRARHQAAPGRAGHLAGGELLLRGDQLLLHLLRLLEQLGHVGLTSGEHATRVGRGYDEQRHAVRCSWSVPRASGTQDPRSAR